MGKDAAPYRLRLFALLSHRLRPRGHLQVWRVLADASGVVVLVSVPRFIVSEISGLRIRPGFTAGGYGPALPLLPVSVSVLDTAYAHREVARFDQGSNGRAGGVTAAEARQRAQAEARRLNEWDANTDAPLDFPRLHVGWDGAA